ncbi:tetraspanin-1-like [Battus philenor]|uniref:tetraspanin-1-like n=1 Tax=Battus philenor TaxID=42288 RepID=UPI0035D0534F
MHTTSLPRTCLSFMNITFFSIAMISCIVCVWCIVNTDMFREVNYTVTKSHLVPAVADIVNLKLWVTPLTSIIIIISGFTMFTSCCGIMGAGCKLKCAIQTYVFLVTIVSVVAFWLFFVSGIYNIYTNNPSTRRYLQSTVRNYYGKEKDLISAMWDYVMVNYECCGANNYEDFKDSEWQKKNPGLIIPVQCCVLKNRTIIEPLDPECTKINSNDLGNYKTHGCFEALRESIKTNKRTFMFYALVLSLSFFVIISFSFCLIRGEPLVDSNNWMPIKMTPPKSQSQLPVTKEVKVALPRRSIGDNAMFTEEPPKKIVKVISALNPGQTYKFDPNMYKANEISNIYRSNDASTMLRPNDASNILRPNETSNLYRLNEASSMYKPNEVSNMIRPNEASNMIRPNEANIFRSNKTSNVYRPNNASNIYKPSQVWASQINNQLK